MAKFIQLSTLPYNHFVESSNKQSLFQAAAAAANAFAYNKKKCLALLFIAVVIALVVSLKKLSSFIRSCIGDVIYDRYEKAKIK
jgi:hypothetical protein